MRKKFIKSTQKRLNFACDNYIFPKTRTHKSRLWTPYFARKGCGMGPWLVLVSPCFRENVVATCKIGSFLWSLDNLLQKNVIVLSFGNQISKWRSFEKGAIFDLLFTFFSYQGKVTKIPSAYISLTYIHVFCSLIDFFGCSGHFSPSILSCPKYKNMHFLQVFLTSLL